MVHYDQGLMNSSVVQSIKNTSRMGRPAIRIIGLARVAVNGSNRGYSLLPNAFMKTRKKERLQVLLQRDNTASTFKLASTKIASAALRRGVATIAILLISLLQGSKISSKQTPGPWPAIR